MGKIFGIADLPISTIMSPFEPPMSFRPPFEDEVTISSGCIKNQVDTFVSKNAPTKSNPFISMRNGFGELMRSFSGKLVK